MSAMKRIALVVMMSALFAFAQQNYFPKGTLSSNDWVDGFKSNWYGTQLKALDEPSLSQKTEYSSLQAYRFTWLRSFHHILLLMY